MIDVRKLGGWADARIPGSVNQPHRRGVLDGIGRSRPTAAIPIAGHRASIWSSLLRRDTAHDVIWIVDGGVRTWQRSGWPVDVHPRNRAQRKC